MANTYVDYTATAAQQYFAFNFPYLEDEHVVVEIEGVDQTITTNYTIETSPTQRINLSNPTTALAGGELVRIKRRSAPNTNLVDFQNGSVLTESELDRAYLHNRYLAEEATEGVDAGLRELEGSTNFNANNKQIKNLADGTLATDAVNKQYVDTQIALTDTNLAGFYKSTHTGNAVDNVFTLSFTPQTTDAKAYIVSIDGLVQVPDTDYTIGAAAITFNTIPANSAEICVVATAAASVATVNEAQVTALGTSDTRSLATWTRDLGTPTATGSTTARSLEDRFADVVNVLDFIPSSEHAAIKDGTTTYDATDDIQAVLDIGGYIVFTEGTYKFNTVFLKTDTYIDFQGSTIERHTSGSSRIFESSVAGDLTMRNGTIDGQNNGGNRGHLLQYQASSGTLRVENMTFQNNCLGYPTNPTTSQDTDLIYVLEAAETWVTNCRFDVTSRNGISFVDATATVKVSDSYFENCYLYAVDFEPNSPTTHMYENVVITGNTFKDNGNHETGDAVWPASGTGAIQFSPYGSTTVIIGENVVVSDNIIINTYSHAGVLAPFVKLNYIKALTVNNNLFDESDNIQLHAVNTVASDSIVATGNKFHGLVFIGYDTSTVVFDGNDTRGIQIGADNANIVSNTFDNPINIGGVDAGIRMLSSVGTAIISSNHFKGSAYAVDTTHVNDNLVVSNNTLESGVELYNIALGSASTTLGTPSKYMIIPKGVVSSTSDVSIPDSTATTVLDLTGKDSAGLIAVIDPFGSRLGSFAMFGSFYDGTNTTAFLTNVQNSGHNNSALTLVGNEIKFSHTFGFSRNLTVNIIYHFNS